MSKIGYVERRISSGKTKVFPMEAGRKELDDHMIGSMRDAEKEIAEAFGLLSGFMGYASIDLNGFDRSTADPADLSEYQHQIMGTLKHLKKNISQKEYGLTIDLAVFCFGLDDVCKQRAMRQGAVIKMFTDSLHTWCELRGWGDQFKACN